MTVHKATSHVSKRRTEGFEDLVNLAVLALVIGTSTIFKECRVLREAEWRTANMRRKLEDYDKAREPNMAGGPDGTKFELAPCL
ncbi:MAG: hypothetical protein WC026_15360 [Hyphomicrobium sp.]|uniref:hypothetical protein n=1 Tax=Hyphomicrobium sp. TaxID=82 RepID=UPI003565482A